MPVRVLLYFKMNAIALQGQNFPSRGDGTTGTSTLYCMATNKLSPGISDLFQLAAQMAKGLTTYGPWLLKGAPAADSFDAFLTMARDAEGALSRACARKDEAATRFAAADSGLTSWLEKARLAVMLAYGDKWTESWVPTGFTHRNVPRGYEQRMELALQLSEFFAENREYEVPFSGVTAEKARLLYMEVDTQEQLLRTAKADWMAKMNARNLAKKRLRVMMRKVKELLSIPLGKSDPRWLAFGLNPPKRNVLPARKVNHVPANEPVPGEFTQIGAPPNAAIA
jgi:hypothetical protein